MIYGSVCSGIEAATVAWHPLGWRPAFFSEIEAFPRAVLAHHYPDVPCHGDFTTIERGDYEPIDLLVGGTPCQSFSVAGLRGGLADDRGNLALEFLRLAQRLGPRWLVWENVPGVLSSGGGRDFGSILGGLVELGYGFAYRVLDAQHFGVPQRRRRVFVVGYLGDWRRAAAVLFERHSLSGNPPPSRDARARVAGALAGISPGGGWRVGADEAAAGQLVAYGGNDTRGPIDVSTALNAHGGPMGRMDFESETFIAQTLRARDGAKGVDSDCTDTLVPVAYRTSPNSGAWETGDRTDALTTGTDPTSHVIAFNTTQITHPENRSNPHPGDPCHSLAKGGHAPAIAFQSSQCGVREVEPHATLDANNGVIQETTVRRLTPRECERLQGFPDDYTAITARGKPAADGPRYKALGNSMAVPCMRWIGERVAMVNDLVRADL